MNTERRLDMLEMFCQRMISRLRRLEAMAELNGLEMPDEEWDDAAEERRQLALAQMREQWEKEKE